MPSFKNTGGFTALAAGATGATGFAVAALADGGLNGAGPVRRVVFLCVCMSGVTRLRPEIFNKINNIIY